MDVFLGSAVGAFIGYIFAFLIQERKYKYDLSMVSIEKRLEVHQKAYTLFFDIKNYPSGDPLEIYGRGLDFLRNNALYLEKDALEAVETCLNQLEKCIALNDDPQRLTVELGVLESQGEKIKDALKLPKILISSPNRKI